MHKVRWLYDLVGKLLSHSTRINTMKDALEYFRANLVNMIAKYEWESVAIIEDKIIAHGKDVKRSIKRQKINFLKRLYS